MLIIAAVQPHFNQGEQEHKGKLICAPIAVEPIPVPALAPAEFVLVPAAARRLLVRAWRAKNSERVARKEVAVRQCSSRAGLLRR